MKNRISAVVTYCTHDASFIYECIKQLGIFCNDIIVAFSDHFYNGKPENDKLIKKTIRDHPNVRFVKNPFDPAFNTFFWDSCPVLSRMVGRFVLYGPQYWICRSRLEGYRCVSENSDYVLFLDSDEVVEGAAFKRWLSSGEYRTYGVMKLANYWYFRSVENQAKQHEDSILMVKKELLKADMLFHRQDRHNVYEKVAANKRRMVVGVDGDPMFHHYSWARSKEGMLAKTEGWGHSHFKDWSAIIEKEFSHPFNGTDFIHHYAYTKVAPFFKTSSI